MTTEAKVREAYQKYLKLDIYPTNFCDFEAGYMALLNELEPVKKVLRH